MQIWLLGQGMIGTEDFAPCKAHIDFRDMRNLQAVR